jgi:DNA-binding Lrp family transcriptional regulator
MVNLDLKIDKKDNDILWELFQNSRASLSDISKSVGLPKPTIKYRIDQLKKRGVLRKTYSVFNRDLFHFTGYEIFIKLQGIPEGSEQKAIEKVKKNPFVVWFVRLSGRFNYLCTIFTRDSTQFLRAYDEIKSAFHPYVRELALNLRVKSRRYPYPFFKDKVIVRNYPTPSTENVVLSEKQIKILALLSDNSQTPIVDIAVKTKLSEKTVRSHIAYFEKEGIILKHTAELDPTKVGYFSYLITMSLRKFDEEIEQYLTKIPEIVYFAKGAGVYDIRAEFFTEDEDRIYEIEQDLYQKFSKSILSIDVMMFKEEFLLNYFTGAVESTRLFEDQKATPAKNDKVFVKNRREQT